MIDSLKSELRKLLTVRSTYFILLICLGLEVLFAFYITAFHADAAAALSPTALRGESVDAINVLSILCAIVSVLLITHEYRYNTIMYSLTNTKSRTKVLLAKLAVISLFAVAFGVVFGLMAPLLAKLGFALKGVDLVPQEFPLWSVLWRVAFATWAISMLASVVAFIIRVQVGALVTLFVVPSTVESLLGLLLHKNQVYLPFSSVNVLLDVVSDDMRISYVRGALVALAWVVGGLVLSWVLFLKRDAN